MFWQFLRCTGWKLLPWTPCPFHSYQKFLLLITKAPDWHTTHWSRREAWSKCLRKVTVIQSANCTWPTPANPLEGLFAQLGTGQLSLALNTSGYKVPSSTKSLLCLYLSTSYVLLLDTVPGLSRFRSLEVHVPWWVLRHVVWKPMSYIALWPRWTTCLKEHAKLFWILIQFCQNEHPSPSPF